VEHGHKSIVRKTKANYNGLASCATTTTMVSREDQSHAIEGKHFIYQSFYFLLVANFRF
jgi:hypothetical protein